MRVVLDTNVVLSALIFANGRLRWLRQSWQRREITPLVNQSCVEELLRALAYPKFKLDVEEIEELISDYLPYAETVGASGMVASLPRCSDPQDQKFLVLAHAGKAQALVSGDKKLLALAGKTEFSILSPENFRRRLSQAER